MTTTSYLALLVTAIGFLALGFYFFVRIKNLSDFLPIAKSGRARVRSSRAFSASTIATTISLATLITAYFNLANYFGLWLLWTAITAASGMYLVYVFSPRIAAKLRGYPYVPSIHEFLSHEYSSAILKPLAAVFTVAGLLLLLATELLVGSNFLALMIPNSPKLLLVVGLSLVPLIYVILGGFETVVISDRIQMAFIWIMIPAFFTALFFSNQPHSMEVLLHAKKLTPINSGLIWFLVGIFLMNVPTHLSSITVWQRISASTNDTVLQKGLYRSAIGILLSWTLLVVISWAAAKTSLSDTGAGILQDILQRAANGPLGLVLVFIIVVGLYCALLSTASTFLIAISHTFTTDIFGWEQHTNTDAIQNLRRLRLSRLTIIVSSFLSCLIVEFFNHVGYNIADIIFSIYGGALSMFPPIVLALMKPKDSLRDMSKWALCAIAFGFSLGWIVAITGKSYNSQNFIFMSPAIGMLSSAVVLSMGLIINRKKQHSKSN